MKRKLEHCHELSVICARKYGVLRIAIYFAALAIVLFLIGKFIPTIVPPAPLPVECLPK